jgi:hypothetical protein
VLVAMLAPLACSSGTEQDDASSTSLLEGGAMGDRDDAHIVPEGLSVTALAGGNGVLQLIALTLREGPSGPEMYAALRNDGEAPACSAAFSVELFNRDEQSLAAGIGALLTQGFYELADDASTLAACVGPGDVSMVAVMDLPSDLVVEDVGHAVYRCPYFALDVVPIDGLAIDGVTVVTTGAGTSYAGTLLNSLEVTVSHPSVTVFPVNRVGRPLGMASTSSSVDVHPGESWQFETNRVRERGADQVAYPAGALVGDL